MTGQRRCYKDRWEQTTQRRNKEEKEKEERDKEGRTERKKKSQQCKKYQENKEPTTKHGDHFVLGNSPWRGAYPRMWFINSVIHHGLKLIFYFAADISCK